MADAAFNINEERLSPAEYIDFLKNCDLGSQYPKERFDDRIAILLKKTSICLTARDEAVQRLGVCMGITDFAYWLFITDLGVIRNHTGRGIGRTLVRRLHALAGGRG